MAKKKNKKVDTSKMSASEKRAYKANLIKVRDYCRARAKWQKALKAGEIDKKVTLSEFRALKDGASASKVNRETKEAVHDLKAAIEQAHSDNALITRLEKMIAEIKGSEKRNSALAELLGKIGA